MFPAQTLQDTEKPWEEGIWECQRSCLDITLHWTDGLRKMQQTYAVGGSSQNAFVLCCVRVGQ